MTWQWAFVVLAALWLLGSAWDAWRQVKARRRALEAHAATLGARRRAGETDEEFRARVRALLFVPPRPGCVLPAVARALSDEELEAFRPEGIGEDEWRVYLARQRARMTEW